MLLDTKELIKKRKYMTDNTNMQRIQLTELCKNIRKNIEEDLKDNNEKLTEVTIQNMKKHKKLKTDYQ